MSQIKFNNVCFNYEKEVNILENINFEIQENETVGIIGANGAGKTSLLKILLGLEPIGSGTISVNNTLVEKKNYPQIREKMGYLFQDSDNQLFMNAVKDELAFALYNYGFKEDDAQKVVDNTLEKIGISYLKNRKTIKLSGGEKKLVSIAVVMAMNPNIYLLDEPTNSLDPKYRRIIIEILNEIKNTKVIASHDLDLIAKTCSRVIVLYKGKLVYDGKTNDVVSNVELLSKYDLY